MPETTSFRLDFAPHIGFPSPDAPLFGALVGDNSAEAQIAFAAQQGFRRVQDPFTALRSEAAQLSVGRTAADAGVGLGSFIFTKPDRMALPLWSAVDPAGRADLDAELAGGIEIGRRIGSRYIAVLTGTDPDRTREAQREAMAVNLARLADRAADAGMLLCVEAVSGQRLPHMLLHHFAHAVEVVRAAAHPAVRLIFDTAHAQAMDGDLLGNMGAAWDLIELIQLADHPGRCEPGTGEINFERIIEEIERRGFTGPVELEHMWAQPDAGVQRNYLQWLKGL